MPVPETGMLEEAPACLPVTTVILPTKAEAAAGSKTTWNDTLCRAPIESGSVGPLMTKPGELHDIWSSSTVALPLLVTTSICAPLVLPTVTDPKFMEEGETLAPALATAGRKMELATNMAATRHTNRVLSMKGNPLRGFSGARRDRRGTEYPHAAVVL